MKLEAYYVAVLVYFRKQKHSKGWASSLSVYIIPYTDGCKENSSRIFS